jgi:hypothetical protein
MTMIGHGDDAGVHIRARLGNRLLQIGRKGGDSAAARKRVTDERQATGRIRSTPYVIRRMARSSAGGK